MFENRSFFTRFKIIETAWWIDLIFAFSACHFHFVERICCLFSFQWNESMSESKESFKLKNIAKCLNMKWDFIWSRHISFDFLKIWFCEWNTWNVRREKKVYLWCRFRNALIYISYRTCVIVFQANKPNKSKENPENKNPLK